MTGLGAFLALGFRHITDAAALDHILFLVALVASCRFRDWRHLLLLATAFTLGHSVTLALAVTDVVRFPAPWIEFLIPLTIVAACLANLTGREPRPTGWSRPLLAAGFGLIHGAGFANFLREMFSGSVGRPLLAFNLGIEAGQVLILAVALTLLTGFDQLVRRSLPRHGLRIRIAATSMAAAAWASFMAMERIPW